MYLQKLQLINFKNYTEVNLEFSSKTNVLVGVNGSGKTNLLDSIYYLSFTKSAFQASDLLNVRHNQGHFFIRGYFFSGEKLQEVSAGFQPGSRKSFRENNVEYQKLSEHIGKYPVVLITPDDTVLVRGGSEVRRRFFDSIISQVDSQYLDNLIQYNHVLKQRNSLLKMFYDSRRPDWTALEVYDQMLVSLGKPICEKRKAFAISFMAVFERFFRFLVSEKERADLQYSSGLDEAEFSEGLLRSRQKDLALQRTSFGIHKDEYEFRLGDAELKHFGSQGQQKSFVVALKLTQWELIRDNKGFKPILLLDDIFDKLDDFRIARLLQLIKDEFGQLFITDARPERTEGLLRDIEISDVSVFKVENGEIYRS